MKRIIDVNLNRTAEGLRILEEISRFVLNNRDFSLVYKKTRHKICQIQEADYQNLLIARDSLNDIEPKIQNPDSRVDIETIFKANVKRIQQSLRVLEEYDINNSSVYEKLRYQIYDFEKKMWSALKLDLKKYLLNNRNLYLVTNSDGFESDDKFFGCCCTSFIRWC
ncbi:MAG: thiamine-phosphate pyrophosphorylase [Candidatus Melainabacteria bacterium]|nr:MAG: thiamine-phosphate pyrophosphorylase [Candidatus Melainabacteria bacterium]